MMQRMVNMVLLTCLSKIMLNDIPHAMFPETPQLVLSEGGAPIRMDKLEYAFIRSDAKWFLDAGFISRSTYDRVLRWLGGNIDPEIQSTVAMWIERDIQWFAEMRPAATSHFWYLYPATKVGFDILEETMSRWVRELRGGS